MVEGSDHWEAETVLKAERWRAEAFQLWSGEDSWESLGQQDIKPVHPKGSQPWISIGGTDAEAEAPILWPPDGKSQLIGNNPDAGKDWGREEKGLTEDEMVGWHHWLSGREFEQTPGDSEGPGSLVGYSSWGRKESDTTECGLFSLLSFRLIFLLFFIISFVLLIIIFNWLFWSLCYISLIFHSHSLLLYT